MGRKSGTGVLLKRSCGDTGTYREEMAMWRWRQKLRPSIYKQRDTKGRWQPPEVGGGHGPDYFSERLRGNHSCRHLDFGLLVSRTVRKQISVALSHPACGTLVPPYPLIHFRSLLPLAKLCSKILSGNNKLLHFDLLAVPSSVMKFHTVSASSSGAAGVWLSPLSSVFTMWTLPAPTQ